MSMEERIEHSDKVVVNAILEAGRDVYFKDKDDLIKGIINEYVEYVQEKTRKKKAALLKDVRCPECGWIMEIKGTIDNDTDYMLTLYQCPKCKNVELES